jgi:hypothetical protein
MNPLQQLISLFMNKYGASQEEATTQARFYVNKANDEMGASFIAEAKQFARQQQRAFETQSAATAASRPVVSQLVPEGAGEPGKHQLASNPAYNIHGATQIPAPLPAVPAAPTPEHDQDANIAAWQRYSDLMSAMKGLSGARDASSGAPAGRRN